MTLTTSPNEIGQIVWELTLKCNLKCIHCGSNAGKTRKNELTTTEALNLCNDLIELNPKEICLMGGEPFLRKDWRHIAQKITDNNIHLLFITNGYKNSLNLIRQLAKLNPYGVATSLDAGTPTIHDTIRGVTGSYKNAINFIAQLTKANLSATIITTVNKLNIEELPKIRDYILNKNIAWQIQIGTPEGRFPQYLALSKEEYYSVAMFIAQQKKQYTIDELPIIGAHCFGYYSRKLPWLGLYPGWNGCQAGISILSIKSNGDITGCLALPDSYIEGNIRQQNIKKIWDNPNSFSYTRNFKTEQLGPNCSNCLHGPTCKGGCLGMSLGFTKQPYNHPYCFHHIELNLFPQKKQKCVFHAL